MTVVFVTPSAGLAAVAVLLPLLAYVLVRLRARRVRGALRLAPPRRRSGVLVVVAIVLLAVLVGVASAQPVVVGSEPRLVRQDAEAYFVLDITRSMLASSSETAPTRLERARAFAERVRGEIADVPAGIASFTNRLVPHVFPTSSLPLFGSGLARSIAIERPAPDRSERALVTALDALAPLATHNFYSPQATRRVAVVLTDGEALPVSPGTVRVLRSQPRIDVLLVRFWSPEERIFNPRLAIDAGYEPDASAAESLDSFAAAVGARIYDEEGADAVAREVRRRLGEGRPVEVGREVSARPLAAWAIGLAFVPLGFLLARRNLL